MLLQLPSLHQVNLQSVIHQVDLQSPPFHQVLLWFPYFHQEVLQFLPLLLLTALKFVHPLSKQRLVCLCVFIPFVLYLLECPCVLHAAAAVVPTAASGQYVSHQQKT